MIGNQHLVLIVDDYEPILNFYAKICKANGFQVFTASNALDAISKLTDKVDLLLTDHEMVGMNGSDLCQMAKKKFHIPVVMVTGMRDINPEKYLEHFDTVILKPFPPGYLVRVLKNILSRLHSYL